MTRAAGFGPEVKRRIMIGTYALSAGYYDAYYNQAQKVRTLIARDLDEAYRSVDAVVSPATPTTAFRLGEKVDDPLAMYLFDLCTLPLNLAGHCGMSVPAGLSPDDGLPVGLQIMAPALADDRLYRVGAAFGSGARPAAVSHLGLAEARWARRAILRLPTPWSRTPGKMKSMRIGVLTGGGDCPGLNAVIRAVVRTGRLPVRLVGGRIPGRLARIACRTGASSCITTTATTACWPRVEPCWAPRAHPNKLRAGLNQIQQTLDDNGIDVLIPIGGEGTLTAAHWLSDENVPVVGVPKTIDNDIDCTDVTFGHDTAVDGRHRRHRPIAQHRRIAPAGDAGRGAWAGTPAGSR